MSDEDAFISQKLNFIFFDGCVQKLDEIIIGEFSSLARRGDQVCDESYAASSKQFKLMFNKLCSMANIDGKDGNKGMINVTIGGHSLSIKAIVESCSCGDKIHLMFDFPDSEVKPCGVINADGSREIINDLDVEGEK